MVHKCNLCILHSMKVLAIVIFFYILVLFQTSFLIHFNIFWSGFLVYSFILILIVFLSFFVTCYQWLDVSAAFAAGFFLDIFSGNFIGFHILILVGLIIFIKFILQKYVQIQIFKQRRY